MKKLLDHDKAHKHLKPALDFYWKAVARRFSGVWYRRAKKPMEGVCGLLYGHDLRGDRGYGGGDMMDVHCSVCDLMQQIPAREDSFGEFVMESGVIGATLSEGEIEGFLRGLPFKPYQGDPDGAEESSGMRRWNCASCKTECWTGLPLGMSKCWNCGEDE